MYARPILAQWVVDALSTCRNSRDIWRTGVIAYHFAPLDRVLLISVAISLRLIEQKNVELQVVKAHPMCDGNAKPSSAELKALLVTCKSADEWCDRVSALQRAGVPATPGQDRAQAGPAARLLDAELLQ